MDKIDKLFETIQTTISENQSGEGLGYIDMSELTAEEKEKFLKNFEPIASDSFMIKRGGRIFTIDVIIKEE